MPVDENTAIRDAAIRHCRILSLQYGEAVPSAELWRGFPYRGGWIKLASAQGIFKPKELTDGPLTLRATLASSFEDEDLEGDKVLYDYAPRSREYENDGLKRIASQGKPVVLLKQVKPKPHPEYMIFAPVTMLDFDDVARKFRLNLAIAEVETAGVPTPNPTMFSKAYAETITKARLHQAHFRREILDAYRARCCICLLRERPLLDAAHIVPDRLPESMPRVQNGLAMCPTHHRAYDQNLLVVTETYRIEIRNDRLTDANGDAAQRMLLDYHDRHIFLPKNRGLHPDPGLLRRKIELAA